jgi:hypothetical protein
MDIFDEKMVNFGHFWKILEGREKNHNGSPYIFLKKFWAKT